MTRYRLGVDSRIARPLTLAAAGLAAFAVVMVSAYAIGPTVRWDATALHGLRTLSEHRWIWVINDGLAHSVDLPWLMMGLLAVCGAGVLWGRNRQAVGAAVLVVGACLTSQLIKIVAAHPRYQPILGANQLSQEAFPSGHATAAMALALAAILVAPSRWRLTTAIVGGGFALAVSMAVMIQGWHFPSDVLAGVLISGSFSLLVLAGLRASDGARKGAGTATEHRSRVSAGGIGARAFELLAVPTAIAIGLLAITHPNELTSYAATHTSGVVAAFGIAAALISVVYTLASELETR
jgi:membrane-associated phospholipid phosphatase